MRQRAVFLTPVVPGATGNGLSMRAGVWLEALAQTHDVDLFILPLFPAHASAPPFTRPLTSTITIAEVNPDLRDGGFIRLTDRDAARLAALRASSDLVVVLRLYLAHLVPERAAGDPPAVLDLDDVDWVRERRLGNSEVAAAFESHAAKVRDRYAVWTAANLDELAAVSPAHAGEQRAVVCNPARAAIPNFAEADGQSNETFDLICVGTLGYEPNHEGALWFIDEVLPLLPGVRVAFVGANPRPELLARSSAQVMIAANVAEVSSWLARARVAIVPVHAGSGSRTKIPEAWAHHRPVVSTTIGAEGITEVRERGSVLLADTPDEFAAACRDLLSDPARVAQLTAAGAEHLDAAYSLTHAVNQIALAIALAQERTDS